MTIGERIAQARLNLGARRGKAVTQTEIARLVGVMPATVSQWESGTVTPALGTIPKIAEALDVTPGFLAFGEPTTQKPADQGGLPDLRAGAIALTPAQIARAQEQAARDEAAASPSVRPARRRGTRER